MRFKRVLLNKNRIVFLMIKNNSTVLCSLFIIVFCAFIVFYYLSFSALAYTSNDAINVVYTVNRTKVKPEQSIEITMQLINNTNHSMRGVYFSDHLPPDLIPQTTKVCINGIELGQASYSVNITFEQIYDGTMANRWILETPPSLNEAHPIPGQGGILEIIYTLSRPKEGNYQLSINNWVGFLDNFDEERVFGFNEPNINLVWQKPKSSEYDPIYPYLLPVLQSWPSLDSFYTYQNISSHFGSYTPMQSYLPYQFYMPYQASNSWSTFSMGYNYNYFNYSPKIWQIPVQFFDNYQLLNYCYPTSGDYLSSFYWHLPNW